MNHEISLSNNDICLRPLAHEDIEWLRVWRNDPENSRFLKPIPYITPEMQEAWFREYLGDPDTYTWAIDETRDMNRLVGSVSLYHFIADIHEPGIPAYDLSLKKDAGGKDAGSACEFGRLMIGDPEARGRKIGFMATTLCVDIAFRIFGVEWIYLFVAKGNIPAYKIYRAVGFG
jgi:RimJ/RimL family protein N-acetyltransferase